MMTQREFVQYAAAHRAVPCIAADSDVGRRVRASIMLETAHATEDFKAMLEETRFYFRGAGCGTFDAHVLAYTLHCSFSPRPQ